ncbi:hypothetical protein FXW07_04890 [Methanosarcina sp. DH1]|uniref:hypothetical protein n=1 Tax=Methanosarcina sp. DH1 TaxID=2605695 RepID=UPI001E638BFA|nr:hypothetical protein [Methanosarcina sp. DH1]MCC4765973.1 hypothetical protein [Methanosarcina sp. DH1]
MDKTISIRDLIGFYEDIMRISTQNNEEPKPTIKSGKKPSIKPGKKPTKTRQENQ